MFDVAYSEFFIVALVALVVIGPKDLPKAMRVLGLWVGRARGMARQFRSGFDNMVREAELEEMEKKWAEENKRIMAEHGAGSQPEASTGHDAVAAAPSDDVVPYHEVGETDAPPGEDAAPVSVEKPRLTPAPLDSAPAADAKANS